MSGEETIFGLHAVAAALKREPDNLRGIWIERRRRDLRVRTLLEEAKRRSVAVYPVDRAELEADPVGPNSLLGTYTNFMNLLDLCAVATPAGETVSGLPFGITWISPRDTDQGLLELAMNGPKLGSGRVQLRLDQDVASDSDCPSAARTEPGPPDSDISLLLFGAHMRDLPLNPQVLGLGAAFVSEVQTAPLYKMVYLPEPAPHRPGIVRVDKGGVSIAAEEWSFPKVALGELLATIRQPLGLGEIELSDGRKVHGFLCEAAAAEVAKDISASGGWRSYLATR